MAWQVAARHPDRVRSLTALSVPHPVAFRDALATDEDQRRRSRYMRRFQSADAERALPADDPELGLRRFFDGGGEAVDVERYWCRCRSRGGSPRR